MPNRDEYVNKLKAQIDAWNAEAARWEQKAKAANEEMRLEFQRQVEIFRKRSEDALADLSKTLQAMKDAFERARREFDRK